MSRTRGFYENTRYAGVCSVCRRALPHDMFYRNKANKFHRQFQCKECVLEIQKEKTKKERKERDRIRARILQNENTKTAMEEYA